MDIDMLIDNIDAQQILTSLGVDYEPAMKNEIRFLCPWHKDSQPSLYFNMHKKIWHCLGCSERGTLLQFIQKYKNLTVAQAIDYLAKFANIDDNDKDNKIKAVVLTEDDKENRAFVKKMVRLNDNAPLEEIEIEWFNKLPIKNIDYLENRGFTLDTIKFFELKVGNFAGEEKIIIPIKDDKERLVGYSLRKTTDDKTEKYKHKANMQKHKILYNLCNAKKYLEENSEAPLVICEGFSDVWKMHQYGIPTAVAIMGSMLSEKQEDLVLQYAYEIVVAPDNDDAGIRAAADIIKRLNKFVKIKLFISPKGMDVGDLTKAQFEKCLKNIKEMS